MQGGENSCEHSGSRRQIAGRLECKSKLMADEMGENSHRDSAEPGAVHGPAPRVHQETDHEVRLGGRVQVAAAQAAAGVRRVVIASATVCTRLRRERGRQSFFNFLANSKLSIRIIKARPNLPG